VNDVRGASVSVWTGRALLATALAVWIFGAGAPPARADDTYWILPPPAEGAWSDPANWSDDAPVLGPILRAYIDNGGTALISTAGEGVWRLWVGDACAGQVRQTDGDLWVQYGLYLGYGAGSTGTYTLEGGLLKTSSGPASGQYGLYVGYDGVGLFRQIAGQHDLAAGLHVGTQSGGTGLYEMLGGTLEVSREGRIGSEGTGTFRQTGGQVHIGDALYIRGHDIHNPPPTGQGTWELLDGELHVRTNEEIYRGGTFTQSGGVHRVGYSLTVMESFELRGGALEQGFNYSGGNTHVESSFLQLPGTTFTAHNEMHVASNDGSAQYDKRGGQLSAGCLFVGHGTFIHAGGTTDASARLVTHGGGTFRLDDGVLNVDGYAKLGRHATDGTFIHNGGDHTIAGWLEMGGYNPHFGRYRISGGSLSVGEVYMGDDGPGILEIAAPAANITVSERLHLGPRAEIEAAPGASIHMTGSEFANESTSPENLAGLKNVMLIFEGGTDDTDAFEVAGADRGGSWEAFHSNFTLGTLQLGGAEVGRVQLVDGFDNQADGQAVGEALYVRSLQVEPGSTLNLNGLNLYCLDFRNQGVITGGTVLQVPAIRGVSATYLGGGFDAAAGVLTVSDAADVVVESTAGQVTYAAGGLVMTARLQEDRSAGGLASGLFRGGGVKVTNSAAEVLLAGELRQLALDEVADGEGLLAGSGWFELTGGVLEEAFGQAWGEVVQITFNLDPADVDDFAGDFSGVSNITLEPVPEPGALALLAAGACLLLGRRRRWRRG